MTELPRVPSVSEIKSRLEKIFPDGLEMRTNLVREMAAKVVYVFLYGDMVEGKDRFLQPSHVYKFTDVQAALLDDAARELWFTTSTKSGFRAEGRAWYADTSKEPIRDDTIKNGFLKIGAVGKRPGVAVTANIPVYFLQSDFAGLFHSDLQNSALDEAIQTWRIAHLSHSARARMAILAAGNAKQGDEVQVRCPDGTVAKLSPGLSSRISKAVIENFAEYFLQQPALIWLSESGNKVRHQDAVLMRELGMTIDRAKVLPDIILAELGATQEDLRLLFIEVVATDGPMNQARKDDLMGYVRESKVPPGNCIFGTAFQDRGSSEFRKALPTLAWGTFAWFASEPDRIMRLDDTRPKL
jgi:hypothetical protein